MGAGWPQAQLSSVLPMEQEARLSLCNVHSALRLGWAWMARQPVAINAGPVSWRVKLVDGVGEARRPGPQVTGECLTSATLTPSVFLLCCDLS